MRLLGVLVGSLAIALVAWVLLRRRDVIVASLAVAPATVAVEQLLKLAGRRSLGLESFGYPSGRVALATSLVLLLVLVLRAAAIRLFVRALVAVLGTVYVQCMAWARVATGEHMLTDVLGGVFMGVAVTLATVLVLTARRQRYSETNPSVSASGEAGGSTESLS
jgi:membrane-associated phospholipid phosphatase